MENSQENVKNHLDVHAIDIKVIHLDLTTVEERTSFQDLNFSIDSPYPFLFYSFVL